MRSILHAASTRENRRDLAAVPVDGPTGESAELDTREGGDSSLADPVNTPEVLASSGGQPAEVSRSRAEDPAFDTNLIGFFH